MGCTVQKPEEEGGRAQGKEKEERRKPEEEKGVRITTMESEEERGK